MTKRYGWDMYGGRRQAFSGRDAPLPLKLQRREAAWCSTLFCEHETRQSIVMDDEQVVVVGTGLVAALNPATGVPQWRRKCDVRVENRVAMNDELLMAGDFVIRRSTGRVVSDIAEMVPMPRSRGHCNVYPLRDGFVRPILDDEQGEKFVWIARDGSAKTLYECDYYAWALDPEREVLIGHSRKKPEQLSRIAIETGQVLWSFDPPRTRSGKRYICSWVALGERFVYAAAYNDSLLAVDLETGREAWIAGAQSKTEWDRPLGYVVPSQVLVSGRYAVITDFKPQPGPPGLHMACFNSETGAPIWNVGMRDSCRHMCILGAYIFGTQDDHPVAWSLESGQIVWEGEGFIKPAYVLAHGNRVIYETVASELVCYEF